MTDRPILPLRAAVRAWVNDGQGTVWREGIIAGRTFEEHPCYDVRFADGSIAWNIPANRIQLWNGGKPHS